MDPLGVQLTAVAHLKALIALYWNLDRPEAWQNFYYGPRPLEKGHKKSVLIERDCKTYSRVPNISAARLLIFAKIFLPTRSY